MYNTIVIRTQLILGGTTMNLEEDYFFQCPYCSADIWVKIDQTGGRKQTFMQDCEVCCQPIDIRLTVGQEGVEAFNAEREA